MRETYAAYMLFFLTVASIDIALGITAILEPTNVDPAKLGIIVLCNGIIAMAGGCISAFKGPQCNPTRGIISESPREGTPGSTSKE